MKILHLADLHLGKRVNEFSMLNDQRSILQEILKLCDEKKPDAIVIAGDVYDRAIPSADAVDLFDDFLTELAARPAEVLMICGNHDSAERLNYGSRMFEKLRVHIACRLTAPLPCVTLRDEFGEVHFHLMPFLRPADVRALFPDEEAGSYQEAVKLMLDRTPLETADRNVLVAHQFFIAPGQEPLRSDSETVSVGGLDSVDASLLRPFDYAALGHLHGPQAVGRSGVRYGGSPLKYSFSEARQTKGVTWVELGEKGDVQVTLLPLQPLHDLREIRGPFAALTSPEVVSAADSRDYLRVILTDEEELPDAVNRLRIFYPNLMRLDYDNTRTRTTAQPVLEETRQKSALELFRDFYLQQNGAALNETQEAAVLSVLEELGGEQA